MSQRGKIIKTYKAAIETLESCLAEVDTLTLENQTWVAKKLAQYQHRFKRMVDREEKIRQDAANREVKENFKVPISINPDDLPF